MFTFYQSADTLPEEQDQFERDILSFTTGDLNPIKFKGIRVAHGVYEQRQLDTYMIRIRCAAGGITPTQLKKVAQLGDDYGNGEVHFTTRQEVQVHDVLIQNVMTVIRGLNEVKLSSRGGGGNTIRNILTSVDSGISPDEEFDVDPYAMALTTRLINETDSWNLPRKFKIAFSNSRKDTSYTQSTCLGFVASVKDGKKGFEVYCAGGMGAKPMVGHALLDWIPDTQVYHVARAIKTMFDQNGNRRSKFSSRIKFLWKKVGDDEFKKLFHIFYDEIKGDESLNLVLPELKNEATDTTLAPIEVNTSDFTTWKQRYVTSQKQPGLLSIRVPLELGDLLREDADTLCDFLQNFGANTIRCERGQNIQLRNIPEAYIGNAYQVISSLKKTMAKHAYFLSSMVNCTGAQTCKLGICLPRGLSTELRDKLGNSDLDMDSIPEFRLNMSGCP
ncbi:MAG: nitrite/sulfite reductase, partial [Candidatus Margulisbacteria bacterium]|nr:nitrite/sulfite reductase [Candidatus Margulisiibacteriota bacterium]